MRSTPAAALLLTINVLVGMPAMGHHSYAAFDASRTQTLEGTMQSFDWTNPHVVMKVLVRNQNKPQEWSIGSSSPAILARFGWKQNSVKPGDHVRLVCNPLRDGTHEGRLHTLVVLDTGVILKTKLSGPADPQ